MPKRINKPTVLHVKTAEGSFKRFVPLGYGAMASEWELTALSYLSTRAEYRADMTPGYCQFGEQAILGFQSSDGRFIT